ncbi:MAG TPA: hypothetical protein VIT23_00205 [Terrimicrobiaceae bacterium]
MRKVVAESSDDVSVEVKGFGAPLTLGHRASFGLRFLKKISARPNVISKPAELHDFQIAADSS